jgi:hypothetical protein
LWRAFIWLMASAHAALSVTGGLFNPEALSSMDSTFGNATIYIPLPYLPLYLIPVLKQMTAASCFEVMLMVPLAVLIGYSLKLGFGR